MFSKGVYVVLSCEIHATNCDGGDKSSAQRHGLTMRLTAGSPAVVLVMKLLL